MKTPNITYTVHHDLCTGCGICEGMCPSNAISFIVTEGTFRPVVNNSLCKNENGCHRCFDSCPGDEGKKVSGKMYEIVIYWEW